MAKRHPKAVYNGVHFQKSPTVYLNVYLLFSADFQSAHYLEGLHWLSLVIQFFQFKGTFSAESTAMPEGINKLTLELVNVDIDNMSRFWGALGAHYQPSVIYKMRMIAIDSGSVEAELAGVSEPDTSAAQK